MPTLMAILGLNAKPFNDTLHDSSLAAKRFGRETASSIGELALGAFAGFSAASMVEQMVGVATRVKELSELFHVSTDTIQMWDKAAIRVGLTAEDVGNAMNRLKKAREAAISKGEVGGFGVFGLGMADIKNQALDAEGILMRMREAAAGHPLTDQEDVAGMELMGKSGAKILSVMEQLNNLGPVHLIPKDDIDNIHEAELRLRDLKNELTIGTAKIVGETVPAFDKLARRISAIGEFMGGKSSFSEMINRGWKMGADVPNIPAPTTDLKGRPLTGPKAQPAAESGLSFSRTTTVDLNKDAAEIEKLRTQLAEKILQNQMKSMTAAERELEIKKQIAEHEKKAMEFRFGEGDEKKALLEDLEVQKLKGEMATKKASHQKEEGDSLSKFGGHLLLASGPETAAAKLEENTRKSEEHLRFIAQWAAGTGLGKGQWHAWSRYKDGLEF